MVLGQGGILATAYSTGGDKRQADYLNAKPERRGRPAGSRVYFLELIAPSNIRIWHFSEKCYQVHAAIRLKENSPGRTDRIVRSTGRLSRAFA
jgi:hypothetical protein